jgi:hypothetical protein
MAIGATIALPELLRRGYDKVMITGVIQGGSRSGILVPPSVVLVLYGMIARQPVSQLWLAGVFPGPADGRPVHSLHRRPLQAAAASGTAAAGRKSATFPGSGSSACCGPASCRS